MLRPVVHWVPTITTEPVDIISVPVGSEFGSMELQLVQDGYWNPDAASGQRFREYFVPGEDYEISDLSWLGQAPSDHVLLPREVIEAHLGETLVLEEDWIVSRSTRGI